MFEILCTEIKVLSAKLRPNVTFSLNSSKSSTKSAIVSVSDKVLPTTTLVKAANEDMKLHTSVIGNLKVISLKHSMESSLPKVVPA
ncbi:unnamed protein product [Hymenolepis diminuta]|uniref:Uncharacterized protein n=1 Tax=Hymenolepis diminuta TaxID=6216 RepID=A0A564ZDP6_HYMDI|nr:unnamed protein product [Hymenolepis diminuta]